MYMLTTKHERCASIDEGIDKSKHNEVASKASKCSAPINMVQTTMNNLGSRVWNLLDPLKIQQSPINEHLTYPKWKIVS